MALGRADPQVFTAEFVWHLLLTIDPRFSSMRRLGIHSEAPKAPSHRGGCLFCVIKDNASQYSFRFSMFHWKIDKGRNLIIQNIETLQRVNESIILNNFLMNVNCSMVLKSCHCKLSITRKPAMAEPTLIHLKALDNLEQRV